MEVSGDEVRLYEALRAAGDVQEIVQFAQQHPVALDDSFLDSVRRWADQAEAEGNANAALGLRQRLSVLEELRRAREREAALPPLGRALMLFVRAGDEAAARKVFVEQRALLETEEAQQGLETAFRSDDEEGQRRLAERSRLLRRLRADHFPGS